MKNLILFLLIVLLSSCSEKKKTVDSKTEDNVIKKEQVHYSNLYDSYGLLEIDGEKVEIGRLKESPMMDINTIKKTILASTGCNSFSTSFEFDEKTGSFVVDFNFAMTQMACVDYSVEKEFLNALQRVDSYKRSDNDLLLLSKGKVVLKYRRVD